jgi:hypothetical protein
MPTTNSIREIINRFLRPLNLKIQTLTAYRIETARLCELQRHGQFSRSVFPPLKSIDQTSVSAIVKFVQNEEEKFKSFNNSADNAVGYSFCNDYFTSPDTEVLYSIIRIYRPARIIEVGSGNSTRISRQAILDGKLKSELIAIDPSPRCDVTRFADRVIAQNVETMADQSLFSSLEANDILFIDSSHEVRCGNDVVFLLLNILPFLRPGVLVHLHDIFLPYEYPENWIVNNRWTWNEQYLVQALLAGGNIFHVLWAGHYSQKSNPDFKTWFAHWRGADAKSLWLRKC